MASGLEIISSTSVSSNDLVRDSQKFGFDKSSAELGNKSGSKSVTFGDVLKNSLADTNELIKTADASTEKMLVGKETNLHSLMMNLEKADISLRLLMQVRNKMVDAYREVMRMQV